MIVIQNGNKKKEQREVRASDLYIIKGGKEPDSSIKHLKHEGGSTDEKGTNGE